MAKSEDPRQAQGLAELLDMQMSSIPFRNEGVRTTELGGDKLSVSMPLTHGQLGRLFRRVLPLSNERNLELDRLGRELYDLCDGRRTVEEIVDIYIERWKLSFFEARGLVLSFLRSLVQKNLVLFLTPRPPDAPV